MERRWSELTRVEQEICRSISQAVHVEQVAGLRTYTAGDSSAQTVVLLHGVCLGSLTWAVYIRVLAEAGFHVVAVDLPGFGMSRGISLPHTGTDARQVNANFLALLQQWCHDMSFDDFILIGHSFGAYIGAKLAAQITTSPMCVTDASSVPRVTHVVLVDPWGVLSTKSVIENPLRRAFEIAAHSLQDGPLGPLRRMGIAGKLCFGIGAPPFQGLSGKLPRLLLQYLQHLLLLRPAIGERAFAQLVKRPGTAKVSLQESLLQLPSSVKVLAVYGRPDPEMAIDYRHMVALVPSMRASCEVHQLPSAGHHLHTEHPGVFFELVDSWLRHGAGRVGSTPRSEQERCQLIIKSGPPIILWPL